MLSWWTPTRTTTNWPPIMHSWCSILVSSNERMPTTVPRHLHLDLFKHAMRNVSRLRLCSHTLKVEAAVWLEGGLWQVPWCDKYLEGGLWQVPCDKYLDVTSNMFKTSWTLFYSAKTIGFVSWGNTFSFFVHLFKDFSTARPYLLQHVNDHRSFPPLSA